MTHFHARQIDVGPSRQIDVGPSFSSGIVRALTVALLLCAVDLRRTSAQATIADDLRTKVDAAVTDVLTKSGAPSASIALVVDGRLAYAHAYGMAKLEPRVPATTTMRYSIGSISKQFTATAILLLAEEGKLSLDDPVARWLPDLTRASEVTVRQLLSMTSGYQDYWPQDYVMPPMLKPVTRGRSSTAGRRSRSTSSPARGGSTATPTTSSPA